MSVGVNIRHLRGEFEIKNFEATCAVRSTDITEAGVSNGLGVLLSADITEDRCVHIVSPPVFGTEGQQFRLAVAFMAVADESMNMIPDPDKPVGLTLQAVPGTTIDSYVQLFATYVNVDRSKSRTFSFRHFRKLSVGDTRGWGPDRDPPRGLSTFKEVVDPANGWLHGGALCVEARLLLATDDQTHAEAQLRPSPHKGVCADLGRLFHSGARADVVIKVKDQDIQAHSLILMARSSVFAAMLSSSMQEGARREVDVTQFEAPAVRAAVEFLYTGELRPEVLRSDGTLLEVFKAAHFYDVQGLVEICVDTLTARINVDAVAEWFALADMRGCATFRARCLEFIRVHISEVLVTDGFTSFISTKPALVTEILASIVPPAKRQRTE